MATTKKTTKKPATRTTAKAASVKKTPARKVTAKKASAKSSAEMRSFRLSREDRAFMDAQVTRQTLYWIILVAFIVFVQLWILKLHIEVATILDAQQQQLQNL